MDCASSVATPVSDCSFRVKGREIQRLPEINCLTREERGAFTEPYPGLMNERRFFMERFSIDSSCAVFHI